MSALRLVEKGCRVVMLEKGRRLGSGDFPRSNWNLKRWLWLPVLGFRGPFKMTFLRHVTVLSGVGVGGGSLVYANTLPIPKDDFFAAESWARLADWKGELAPHYPAVRRMLGVTENPPTTRADDVIREIGRDLGLPEGEFRRSPVAVWFGEPGVMVPDPYFGGEGPERTGCTQCGGCMIGCQHGAKNTLDKNYLWLAERGGLVIEADTEAIWAREVPGALFDTPTTAHILGGACMGTTPEEGVIDARHRVFGYEGLYVIDGAAVSANPGVNPALTIAALAERAMSFVPPRDAGPAPNAITDVSAMVVPAGYKQVFCRLLWRTPCQNIAPRASSIVARLSIVGSMRSATIRRRKF